MAVKEFAIRIEETEKEKWVLYGFGALLLLDFLLLHSNQRSSQTLASVALFFSPFVLILKSKSIPSYPRSLKYFVVSILLYVVYQFISFTHFPITSISFAKFRDGMFWLILPISLIVFIYAKLTLRTLFWIFFISSILCLCPILKDLAWNGERGNLSAHPIYWGNISLTTGVIVFVLSCANLGSKKYRYLGVAGLNFGLAASFWSQTRGGWICLPFILFAFIQLRLISIKHLVLLLGLLAGLFSLMPATQEKLDHTLGHLSKIDTYSEDPLSQERSSIQQRMDMWRFVVKYPPENILIGGGFSYFNEKLKEVHALTGEYSAIKRHITPHSEYLEVIITEGLIGFVLFATILFSALAFFKIKVENQDVQIAAYAGCFLIFLFSMYALTEAIFTAKYPLLYFSLCFSLLGSLVVNQLIKEASSG